MRIELVSLDEERTYMRNRYSYHRDYKKNRRNIWESVKQFIQKAFPERSAIFYNRGTAKRRTLSSNVQLFMVVFGLLTFGWMSYTSFVYFQYSDILEDSAQKVDVAQEQYKQIMSVVTAYETQIATINDKIDSQNTKFEKKLAKVEGLSDKEKEAFFKEQQMLAAELGYFNKKIRRFADSQKFAKFDRENIYYQSKKMEIQRDVAWQEQQRVRERNKELETAMSQIQVSYDDFLDKIEVIADDKLKTLEEQYAGIDRTLNRLGLKNEKVMFAKLQKEENRAAGGPFVPLQENEQPTEVLSEKFATVKDKVNLWEGLSKMREMLPLGKPVNGGRISSSFGGRKDPFTGKRAQHNGIDFGGKKGTPLYSVAPGNVIRAGLRGAYGYAVEIDHGLGFTTLYAHLSKITVKVGDEVKPKDIIGLSGSTGRSTAAHLHYEIRHNGRPVNPYSFVKAELIDYEKAEK